MTLVDNSFETSKTAGIYMQGPHVWSHFWQENTDMGKFMILHKWQLFLRGTAECQLRSVFFMNDSFDTGWKQTNEFLVNM